MVNGEISFCIIIWRVIRHGEVMWSNPKRGGNGSNITVSTQLPKA